jgi:hypothetical protein
MLPLRRFLPLACGLAAGLSCEEPTRPPPAPLTTVTTQPGAAPSSDSPSGDTSSGAAGNGDGDDSSDSADLCSHSDEDEIAKLTIEGPCKVKAFETVTFSYRVQMKGAFTYDDGPNTGECGDCDYEETEALFLTHWVLGDKGNPDCCPSSPGAHTISASTSGEVLIKWKADGLLDGRKFSVHWGGRGNESSLNAEIRFDVVSRSSE